MTKAEIAGIPINIVSDEEAETYDYLVCMPWDDASPFAADNMKGACCECGTVIMYRWHAPRKPKRICLECMLKLSEDESQGVDGTTPKQESDNA